MSGRRTRRVASVAVAIALFAAFAATSDAAADNVPVGGVVTEQAYLCGAADLPETGIQGDVPRADQTSGRAERGYNCGLALVGHATLDADGREPTGNANMAWSGDCAYVAGPGAVFGNPSPAPGDGVAVVDVSDPANPQHVRTLRNPGSTAALETLHAVQTRNRAVLVVGQYGNQAGGDKPMDVYDVSDCATPRLLQTFRWPENIHNLTISGNGRYVFATQPLQAVNIDPLFDANPATGIVYLGNLENAIASAPFATGPSGDLDDAVPTAVTDETHSFYLSHEAWPTRDGTKLYLGGQLPTWETFTIVDIALWLTRDALNRPSGAPRVISQRSGRGHSVRTATVRDATNHTRRFALHSEESVFGPAYGCLPETLNPVAGAAQPWLTDITDEANPALVSQFGLEINDPENCPAQMDSGVNASVHYHDVDNADDTTFVMASMWNAGLRVFDIRHPETPREVAYFNPADVAPGPTTTLDHAWGHVRYVPETGHIWFATAEGGFWVVEIEPQVRAQLDLDAPSRDRPRHPRGRAGTEGVEPNLAAVLALDVTQYYCTLGTVNAL
jgi:hypothetical protein